MKTRLWPDGWIEGFGGIYIPPVIDGNPGFINGGGSANIGVDRSGIDGGSLI